MSARFSIRFINKDAVCEYQKLDGSVKKLVNVGLKKLEERADQIGKPLAGGLQGAQRAQVPQEWHPRDIQDKRKASRDCRDSRYWR